MTCVERDFVDQEARHFPTDRTLGEAVRQLIRRRWASNAAKHLEREWDLDPKTAKNVVQAGAVSERTLTKAIRAEGWGFLAALGEELTGHTYDQHLENRIEETRRVKERLKARRERIRQLEARALQPDHMGDGLGSRLDR